MPQSEVNIGRLQKSTKFIYYNNNTFCHINGTNLPIRNMQAPNMVKVVIAEDQYVNIYLLDIAMTERI